MSRNSPSGFQTMRRLGAYLALSLACALLLIPATLLLKSWRSQIEDGSTLSIPTLVFAVGLEFICLVGVCFSLARIATTIGRYAAKQDGERENPEDSHHNGSSDWK
jgi:hypothetical protein